MKRFMIFLCVVAVIGLAAVSAQAAINTANWAESWTDSNNLYHSPDSGRVSSDGSGGVNAAIPTDAIQTSAYNTQTGGGNAALDTVSYLRTITILPSGGDPSLLGNLSTSTGLTATFSLNNNALPSGALFTASNFVGYTTPGVGYPTPTIRFAFTDGNTGDVWFSHIGAISALNLSNQENVTLTASFGDPSQWSDLNGTFPVTTALFDSALSNVTRLGLSFGSGNFFSNGFAFDTGGTASLDLVSIDTTSPVPEPTTMIVWSLLGGFGLAFGYWRRKRAA